MTWRGEFRVPLSDAELAGAVQGVVAHARGAATRDIGGEPRPAPDAEGVGAALAAALLTGPVGEGYAAARTAASRTGNGVRLSLSLAAAPALLSVPWEFLYQRPRFLASQRKSPVVRLLDTGVEAEAVVIDSAVRILGVVASPADLTPLDVAKERAGVEQAVAAMRELGRVELDWLEPATPRRLRETLRDGSYHVLHFIGHSAFTDAGDGVVFLEDDDGKAKAVDETLLANLLADQDRLRLVVLNSCEGARTTVSDPYAGVATTLVSLGVPAVVAMQFQISDDGGDRVRHRAVRQPDRPPGTDRRRHRRGPQGGLQRRRSDRVGDAGAVPARPRRPAVRLRRRRRTAPARCSADTDEHVAAVPGSVAAVAAPVWAIVAGGDRRRGRRRRRRSCCPARRRARRRAPPPATTTASPSAVRAPTPTPSRCSRTTVTSTCSRSTRVRAPTATATDRAGAHDVEPAWDRTTNRLAFRRLEPSPDCTGICYVVPGNDAGDAGKQVAQLVPPREDAVQHAPAWASPTEVVYAMAVGCDPGPGCAEEIRLATFDESADADGFADVLTAQRRRARARRARRTSATSPSTRAASRCSSPTGTASPIVAERRRSGGSVRRSRTSGP